MTKILVIDDQDNLRDEVVDWFIFEGYEAFGAGSGKAGIELALKKLPDLILCDIMMPGMDGFEVFEWLRKNPDTQAIPFIFLTALSERRNIRSGMNVGADDYITKPFTREDLLNGVRSRLAKSKIIEKQARLEMEELRGNLATNLPHELRTPLNGILGFGQFLRDTPEQFTYDEIKEIGNTIFISAQRLFRLINNYQTYARLEIFKETEPAPSNPVECSDLCNGVIKTLQEKYHRESDLFLSAEPSFVRIHPDYFKQLAYELIDNAFKFSEPGQPVMVSFATAPGRLLFTVKDHGRGFRESEIKKIGAWMQFDRTEYEQQGSGFGLTLAKKIAESYGGSLKIESEPGTGTTVTALLPGA